MKPLKLTDQRPFGFFVLWIERANLGVQEIAEK
jgi:hypothetical protein